MHNEITPSEFQLDKDMYELIMFGMENQLEPQALDLLTNTLCELESAEFEPERYLPLPTWTSKDGFQLLEQFAKTVQDKSIRASLFEILDSGKGIFKAYKELLKTYPKQERQFKAFREESLRARIREWYNEYRHLWGLKDLIEEENEFSDLDFTCTTENFNPNLHGKLIQEQIDAAFQESSVSHKSIISHAVEAELSEYLQKNRVLSYMTVQDPYNESLACLVYTKENTEIVLLFAGLLGNDDVSKIAASFLLKTFLQFCKDQGQKSCLFLNIDAQMLDSYSLSLPETEGSVFLRLILPLT